MTIYTPTYLYIKQHSITKKLYFGKTVRDPETYLGSGLHWQRHIKKHGKEHIETLWYCLFLDQDELTKFALMFSKHHAIVESTQWLNLIPENGLHGACSGVPASGKAAKGTTQTGKAAKGIPSTGNAARGVPKSGQRAKGVPRPIITCPHCLKSGGSNAMTRWHFDNCKNIN